MSGIVSCLVTVVMIVLTMCAIVCASCAQDPKQTDEQQQQVVINPIEKTITVGNHSWIQLGWGYDYSDITGINTSEAARILNVVNNFESAKPWLEVIDWKLEVAHKSYFRCQYIYGIWIDHRLKPGYVEEYQIGGYPTGRYIKQEEL